MIGQRNSYVIEHRRGRQEVSFLDNHGNQDGIPFLFLHGWGGNAESWQPLWHAMQKQEYPLPRLIAMDIPGFGESPPPHDAWSLEDFAKCIILFLDTLGIVKVNIVCHSFGGRLAIVLAHLFPNRIEKVVALAPAGIAHHLHFKRLIAFFARRVKKILTLPLIRRVFPLTRGVMYRILGNPEYSETDGVMKNIYQKAIQRDLRPIVPMLKPFFLIFWGRHDTYVPVRDAAILHRLLRSSTVHIFEDGRHGIHKTHAKDIALLSNPLFHS